MQLVFDAFSQNNFFARLKMAYKVNDNCVNCGACEPVCPVEAISEKDGARVIDADKCISCGSCAAECPSEAIEEA